MLYRDRRDAGGVLARELGIYKGHQSALILGLARGGIVVAYEIAKELALPLNIVAPRKIGAPGNPELALGSIMEDGTEVLNQSIIQLLGVPESYVTQEREKEKARARQRLALYRQYAPLPEIANQTVLLVDDGIATGSTMLVSVKAMRQAQAKQIIVAAPVASVEAYQFLMTVADEVVCPHVREDFIGVGMYYHHFAQIEDDEVVQLLKEANQHENGSQRRNNPHCSRTE